MNKVRRKQIKATLAKIDECRQEMESVLEEEQDYLDTMPESIGDGDKGEKVRETIYALEEGKDNLENMITEIEDAIS